MVKLIIDDQILSVHRLNCSRFETLNNLLNTLGDNEISLTIPYGLDYNDVKEALFSPMGECGLGGLIMQEWLGMNFYPIINMLDKQIDMNHLSERNDIVIISSSENHVSYKLKTPSAKYIDIHETFYHSYEIECAYNSKIYPNGCTIDWGLNRLTKRDSYMGRELITSTYRFNPWIDIDLNTLFNQKYWHFILNSKNTSLEISLVKLISNASKNGFIKTISNLSKTSVSVAEYYEFLSNAMKIHPEKLGFQIK